MYSPIQRVKINALLAKKNQLDLPKKASFAAYLTRSR